MPNAIGGLSVANNLLANTALNNLDKNQSSLGKLVNQLSSGLRIASAADDPSGLAIATNLTSQVNGYDQAARNIQDATNAATVADGALSSVTNILQQIRTLAVSASSDITSQSDKQAIQAQINQLLQEVNQISDTTNFNGINLLDGSHAGYQAATNATATITTNSVLSAGDQLVTPATTAVAAPTSATAVDGTIELQVVSTGTGTFALQQTFFNSATGVTTGPTTVASSAVGVIAAGSVTVNGTTINYGAIGTNDVGSTAYIKVSQYVPAAQNATSPALNFQAGANEGAVAQVGIAATNTAQLRISNVNVATNGGFASLGAEDVIGQIDNAINIVNAERAQVGAVTNSLAVDSTNDNTASVNLQASESAIMDVNVGAATALYNKEQILVQIGTTMLAQSNTNAQTVLGLFR
jgi:flagellin